MNKAEIKRLVAERRSVLAKLEFINKKFTAVSDILNDDVCSLSVKCFAKIESTSLGFLTSDESPGAVKIVLEALANNFKIDYSAYKKKLNEIETEINTFFHGLTTEEEVEISEHISDCYCDGGKK